MADPGVENILTVTVKDAGDGFLDSGILIREGAFKTLPAELPQVTGTPGRRDVLTIADFMTGEDRLDLGDAVVENVISGPRQTVLDLEGPDHDLIVLLGVMTYSPDLILV